MPGWVSAAPNLHTFFRDTGKNPFLRRGLSPGEASLQPDAAPRPVYLPEDAPVAPGTGAPGKVPGYSGARVFLTLC
jgi:hypothetical protein